MPATKSIRVGPRRIRAGRSSAKKAWRTPLSERKTWKRFWLVDPLDGTGSYIRMRAGYAVNIALIENDGKEWVPILGVVALPDLQQVYFGGNGLGVFKDKIGRIRKAPAAHPGRRRSDAPLRTADQLERIVAPSTTSSPER